MDLCSYACNSELRFVCADVYAVDCDSAVANMKCMQYDIVQLSSSADLLSQSFNYTEG